MFEIIKLGNNGFLYKTKMIMEDAIEGVSRHLTAERQRRVEEKCIYLGIAGVYLKL